MTILEKEVWVGLGGGNPSFYEQKGYEIPRYINSQGKMKIKRGSKILVKIEDLNENSPVKLTKICDDEHCDVIGGRIVQSQEYKSIIYCRKNGDGKDRCFKCGKKLMGIKMLNNVKYEKSLEYWAKDSGKEYLLDEFSEINRKKPNQISYGSNDKYWWNCLQGHEPYLQRVDIRTNKRKSGCPTCSGNKKKTTEEFKQEIYNLIEVEYRVLGTYVNNNTNIELLHLICGNKYDTTPRSFLSGYRCPYCHQSKGEKRINTWIDNNNIEYKIQKEFENLKGLGGGLLSYDFYLPNENILIEFHGLQHEKFIKNMHGDIDNFEKQKIHDLRKYEFTKQNNIDLLIIWYWDFDNIEEILENKIFQMGEFNVQ